MPINLSRILEKSTACSHGITLARFLRRWLDERSLRRALKGALDYKMMVDALFIALELLNRGIEINDDIKIQLASWALAMREEKLANSLVERVKDVESFFQERNIRYFSSQLINHYIITLAKKNKIPEIAIILEKVLSHGTWINLTQIIKSLKRRRKLDLVLKYLPTNFLYQIIFRVNPSDKVVSYILKKVPKSPYRDMIEIVHKVLQGKLDLRKSWDDIYQLRNLISETFLAEILNWLGNFPRAVSNYKELESLLRGEKWSYETHEEETAPFSAWDIKERPFEKERLGTALIKEQYALEKFLIKGFKGLEKGSILCHIALLLAITRGNHKRIRSIIKTCKEKINFEKLIEWGEKFKRLLANQAPGKLLKSIVTIINSWEQGYLFAIFRLLPTYNHHLYPLLITKRRIRILKLSKRVRDFLLLDPRIPDWLKAISILSKRNIKEEVEYFSNYPRVFPYFIALSPTRGLKIMKKSGNFELLENVFSNSHVFYILKRKSEKIARSLIKMALKSSDEVLRELAKVLSGATTSFLGVEFSSGELPYELIEKLRRSRYILAYYPLILPNNGLISLLKGLLKSYYVPKPSLEPTKYGIELKQEVLEIIGCDDLILELLASPFISTELFIELLRIVMEERTYSRISAIIKSVYITGEKVRLINLFDRRTFLAKLVEKIIISQGYSAKDKVLKILGNCDPSERDSVIIVLARYSYVPDKSFLERLSELRSSEKYYCFLAELIWDSLLLGKLNIAEIKKCMNE